MTVAEAEAARPLFRRLPGARVLRDGRTLYWWAEVLFVAVFYFVYSAIRNSNEGSPATARRHALQIIDIQKFLGINNEQRLQEWALDFKPIIYACNYFYGSLHFIVTAGALIFLFRKHSDDYPLWRNTIAITTALALIGFAFYPLMPPRLMPDSFGFVDTVDLYPAFWSFNRGAVNQISNQFAAMPSVHCAWALFSAIVLFPRLKRTWAKALAAAYPVCTVISIVLTANHYWLDAVGGFAVLGAGYLIARLVTRAGRGEPVAAGPEPEKPPDPVPV